MVKRARTSSQGKKTQPYKKKPAIQRQNAVITKAMIPHKKIKDTVAALSFVTEEVIVTSLNIIDQGTTKYDRIGNRITVTNVNCKLLFGTNGTEYMSRVVRVVLFQDKQNGAATLTAATMHNLLFETSNPNQTDQPQHTQYFRNYENLDRFVILHDETKTLTQTWQTEPSSSPSNFQFEMTFGVKCNIPIYYETSTGPTVQADIKSNNIGMLVIISEPTFAHVLISNRVKYYDN